MKITIESTELLCEISGIPARIWEGTTEDGTRIVCFITRIATDPENSHKLAIELLDVTDITNIHPVPTI